MLLKAPKKKYVKKLVEYAILVGTSPNAIPELAKTPISQDFMTDLELSTEESHQLIISLIGYLGLARKVEFDETALRNMLTGHLSEELCEILIDITIKLSPGTLRLKQKCKCVTSQGSAKPTDWPISDGRWRCKSPAIGERPTFPW